MSRSILLIDDAVVLDVELTGPSRLDALRELRNVLEHTIRNADQVSSAEPLADSLDEVTRRHVVKVLERHKGNRQRTARALGVTRATLYKWLKDWGLERVGRSA